MDLSKAKALFFDEARELCDAFEGVLLDNEHTNADEETFNLLFRTAHTIKGSSGIFGLDALVRFAHVVENVLERLRAGIIALDGDLVSLLLHCNDHLRTLLQQVETDETTANSDLPEGMPLLQQLARYQVDEAHQPDFSPVADSSTVPQASSRAAPDSTQICATSPLWQISLRFQADLFRDGFDPASLIHYLTSYGEIKHVEAIWRTLPELTLLDPTECFLGLEIAFESGETLDKVAEAFEFINEYSLIGLLPPHAPLREYQALAIQIAARNDDPLADALSDQVNRWLTRQALTPDEARIILAGDEAGFAIAESAPDPDDALAPQADTPPQVSAEQAPARSSGISPGRTSARNEGHYIRVEAGKLDRLINRVGELVIAASSTTMIAQGHGSAEMLESVAIVNTLVEKIRDDALTLRMVPVGDIFGRFPRMVREVSQQIGKTIQLNIEGADTEIDKSMVEKLTDPLMHIVRNAVDHGLESPEVRIAANKSPTGTVTLNAYHDAGSVVVAISDDGGGINTDKVLAKAIDQGLIPEGRTLSEQDVFQLIFHPGFSTADKVSDLSGRGVGMDVVKRNIEALRGEIEIQSKRGVGTHFKIRLPLTLAIIDGFRVEVDGSSFVMPLDMMVECIDLPPDAMHHRVRQVNVRGEWLPFVSLRELFDLQAATSQEYIVIVHYGEHRAGIVVDKLMGEVQAVIKPLGELFKSLRGISGSTILGNGKPALILDIPQLVQYALQLEKQSIEHASRGGLPPKRHVAHDAES
ncbi:chemotaxis protein CheA [Burkholderiaceae bacterium DAT-1]|nr:chemotaxis protein CheA [Burkholderiaceae bacterium DAT-1]